MYRMGNAYRIRLYRETHLLFYRPSQVLLAGVAALPALLSFTSLGAGADDVGIPYWLFGRWTQAPDFPS